MRDDALNFHIYPERTKMTSTKEIPVLRVCSTDESELKDLLANKILSQICYTGEDESKGIIVDECYTEKGES